MSREKLTNHTDPDQHILSLEQRPSLLFKNQISPETTKHQVLYSNAQFDVYNNTN